MSLLKYFITMTFALLLLSACTTLEVGVERTPSSPLSTATLTIEDLPINPAATATAKARLTITPSPTPTTDPRVYVGIPRPGTLYLGYVEELPALFIRSPYRPETEELNLGMALYQSAEGMAVNYLYNFQDLSRPRVVLTTESSFELISGARDALRRFLYVSYVTECIPPHMDKPPSCNRLMEIDLDQLTTRDLWLHDFFSDAYPGFHGPVVIDRFVLPLEEYMGQPAATGEHFLILRMLPCYGCEPYPPHVMLVLNVNTSKELYLGKVGNVNIDFIEKVVSYQNLGEQRVKCEPNPLCEKDGYMALYVPTGDLLKQPLP